VSTDPGRNNGRAGEILSCVGLGLFVFLAVCAGAFAGQFRGLAIAVAAAAVVMFWVRVRQRREGRLFSRMLESRLLQAQKMAALGELSAGIAHEINNPLAIIAQETELLRHYLKALGRQPSDALREIEGSVVQINAQVGRCREITHRLLSLARRMDPVIQDIDLNRLVEDMALLVEREAMKRGVHIVRDYSARLAPARTDPPLLRQVVLNLLNNAVQSIKENGQVSIRTGEFEDGYELVIEDTGCGIPPEHLPRIFDPFFTTKPPGQGTGLGLSISQAIMSKLGGEILVESTPGSGSRFTVRLPKSTPGDRSAERTVHPLRVNT
jgi:two-component system, NtrC family, sensor kinase